MNQVQLQYKRRFEVRISRSFSTSEDGQYKSDGVLSEKAEALI